MTLFKTLGKVLLPSRLDIPIHRICLSRLSSGNANTGTETRTRLDCRRCKREEKHAVETSPRVPYSAWAEEGRLGFSYVAHMGAASSVLGHL
jgi:hypothetical protein